MYVKSDFAKVQKSLGLNRLKHRLVRIYNKSPAKHLVSLSFFFAISDAFRHSDHGEHNHQEHHVFVVIVFTMKNHLIY